MIDEVDQGLGANVDSVRKASQLENTFIIYSSDNGGGSTPNGSLLNAAKPTCTKAVREFLLS